MLRSGSGVIQTKGIPPCDANGIATMKKSTGRLGLKGQVLELEGEDSSKNGCPEMEAEDVWRIKRAEEKGLARHRPTLDAGEARRARGGR